MNDRKVVYTIIDGKDDSTKAFWVRIGRAFTNRDDSINIYLDALPTNGRLQVRTAPEKRDDLALGD